MVVLLIHLSISYVYDVVHTVPTQYVSTRPVRQTCDNLTSTERKALLSLRSTCRSDILNQHLTILNVSHHLSIAIKDPPLVAYCHPP